MQEILDGIRPYYASYGYLIVFLGAYLENTVLLGLILPGGTLMILGGVYAGQGTLSLPLVALVGWVGMAMGSSTDYWIGRGGLWKIIERTRLNKWLATGLEEARLILTERGGVAIFLAHFLGQIRTFVALTAGIVEMPFYKFLMYEVSATFVWALIYCGAGFIIGDSLKNIEDFFKILAIFALIITVVAYKLWKNEQEKRAANAKQTEETTKA